jgi:hypothetical protein
MAKRKPNRDRLESTTADMQDHGTLRLARVARGFTTARPAAAADPAVPVAIIAAAGGPVTVGISFGQAQHAQYTIQVFDATGSRELARQTGLNTDAIPDQFTLQIGPGQLDQNILQWSGAISAFSPAPGQQFSITFDVSQNGAPVSGGRVQRTGALTITQAFVGVLRLVAR